MNTTVTSQLLMIRPVHFGYNAETAVNNAFQVMGNQEKVQQQALSEFDAFVEKLEEKGIAVLVINDTPEPHTPDSIFPNNWISFHEGGAIFLYPMFAQNRRLERKDNVLKEIQQHFFIDKTIDLTNYERQDIFLEGTGSMVLDRQNQLAYACLSPRTNEAVLAEFCRESGYDPVIFTATDDKDQLIYHTNVMMCVADKYVVICLETIRNDEERKKVTDQIVGTGKQIIPISMKQMNHFAGNMLQVKNRLNEHFLVMSSQAYLSLTPAQVATLESFNAIIHSGLETIESNGGGSARCMMAEVFLPKKK